MHAHRTTRTGVEAPSWLSLRVAPELLAEVHALAARNERSVAQEVRRALKRHVAAEAVEPRLECSTSPTRAQDFHPAEVVDPVVVEGQVTPAEHGATVGHAAPGVAGVPAAHQPGAATDETEATSGGGGAAGGAAPSPVHECPE